MITARLEDMKMTSGFHQWMDILLELEQFEMENVRLQAEIAKATVNLLC